MDARLPEGVLLLQGRMFHTMIRAGQGVTGGPNPTRGQAKKVKMRQKFGEVSFFFFFPALSAACPLKFAPSRSTFSLDVL